MSTYGAAFTYTNSTPITFFQSVCSTDLYLTNKGADHLINAEAKHAVILNRELWNLSSDEHQTVLSHWLKNEAEKQALVIPHTWNNYFKRLYRISRLANFARVNKKGVCFEAAALSITDSLLHQLKTGTRESVQLISILGDEINNKGSKQETILEGHFVALYNAQIISKEIDLQQQTLNDFFNTIKPIKPHARSLCDAWIKYHDSPNHWWKAFKNDKDTRMENVTWKKLTSTDYSLPSFRSKRTADNPKLRRFLRTTLFDILNGNLERRIENSLVAAFSVLDSAFNFAQVQHMLPRLQTH